MDKFFIDKNDIKKLTELKGCCLASNRITVDGLKVGYMYRETPSDQYPDSGWRFFAGDENEEYCNDAKNFNIFELNTICNYDPSIIPHLKVNHNATYEKQDDKFVEIKPH